MGLGGIWKTKRKQERLRKGLRTNGKRKKQKERLRVKWGGVEGKEQKARKSERER